MNKESQIDNKRVAKNTILLYFRMFLLMGISLFTSRVTLQALGVEDFGIYNVVGGFVVMFSILTGSLTSAISRFITVELGHKNLERLRTVFSTSLKVQLIFSVIIAILAEAIGIWFLYNKMTIPDGRYTAAFWVLQCSIIVFILGLINVPYNSTIVAHEKMSAFAYISILEAVLKLTVVYLLYISPYDKLIVYAVLLMLVQALLRLIYGLYCYKHFEECQGTKPFDRHLFKEMWSFAGWNLLGNGAYILNTQGVNMVMNIFFGVVANAARGIANHVNNAVQQFVNNFMMALTPQITKSYAVGEKEEAFKLTCRGARFSFYLILLISLPIMIEVDQILNIWLGVVPENTGDFVIWTILASIVTMLGNTLINLQMAHGNIKHYQIVMALCGFLPFPLTWIAYSLGAPVIWTFIIYFIVYYILNYVRLFLVHNSTGIPYKLYLKDVVIRTHVVAVASVVLPIFLVHMFEPSIYRIAITVSVSTISTLAAICILGLQNEERQKIVKLIMNKINRK